MNLGGACDCTLDCDRRCPCPCHGPTVPDATTAPCPYKNVTGDKPSGDPKGYLYCEDCHLTSLDPGGPRGRATPKPTAGQAQKQHTVTLVLHFPDEARKQMWMSKNRPALDDPRYQITEGEQS